MNEMIVIFAIVFFAAINLGLVIWGIVHCVKNPRLTDTNRIIGVVLMAVLGIWGCLVYLFLPRTPEDSQLSNQGP